MSQDIKQKKKKHPETPTGNPVGRPPEFKPEYCDLLVFHLQGGESYQSFAAVCDVSIKTLYTWENKYPEFLHAKERGWAYYLRYWEKRGQDGMQNETIKDGDGCTVTRSLNAAIYCFHMKNRFPEQWRDRREPLPDVKVEIVSDRVKELVDKLDRVKNLK